MIAKVTGTLLKLDLTWCLVDTGSIGYKIFIGGSAVEKLSHQVGQQVSLFTYLSIRENAHELYGFVTEDDLSFFELLISVNGIGPKSALSILSHADASIIREAIANEDPGYLTKISGIGRKMAEKIILELKDKLLGFVGDGALGGGSSSEGSMAADALVSLGYSNQDARDALKKIDRSLPAGEQIKEALKLLGSRR